MKLINKILYEQGRKLELKNLTSLGKVYEEEDKLVCYVDERKLKKFKQTYFDIFLEGTSSFNKEKKEVYEYYKIDKPIHYIFDNINFNTHLKFAANNNTHIIFRNCAFKQSIKILIADKITFENNKYYDYYPSYLLGKTFLTNNNSMINTIRFIHEDFKNSHDDHHPTRFGIDIEVENLEIINSNINIDNSVKYNNKETVPNRYGITIKANNTKIINSDIKAAEIYLDSSNIIIDKNSNITATTGMIIENQNKDLETSTSNLKAPYLVYNEVELIKTSNKNISINKDKILSLHKKRTELITLLKRIEEKATIINENKVNEVRKNLNNREIKKVLKR